jgi:hypothetical protein
MLLVTGKGFDFPKSQKWRWKHGLMRDFDCLPNEAESWAYLANNPLKVRRLDPLQTRAWSLKALGCVKRPLEFLRQLIKLLRLNWR